jgi:hypothetical protein
MIRRIKDPLGKHSGDRSTITDHCGAHPPPRAISHL